MSSLADETPNVEALNLSSSPNSADSTDSDDESDDEVKSVSGPAAEKKIVKALGLKEEGNAFFKEKDFDKALRSYRRGTVSLKGLNNSNTGDAQVKTLLISLQNNMAMIYAKQEKYKQALDVTKKALEVDRECLKALFRKGQMLRMLGDYDEAKEALKDGLKVDPESKDIKKEMVLLKKKLEDEKKRAKKAFGGAFDKGTGGLYQDKEEEKKKKAIKKREDEAKEKARKEEEEKKKKRKWEDECVSRMAKSEPPVSYDEWCKELEEAEEAKKAKEKEEEDKKKKAKKEEDRKRREARKSKGEDIVKDDSDDDLGTDKVRGYKLTSDGRKTSFFNNELTDEAKALIGDIAPKPINASATAAPSPIKHSESGGSNASAWNHAGTWEEKDTTDWCKDNLTEILNIVELERGGLTAEIKEVKEISGDASVVVIRGKKRYVFDLTGELHFEVKDGEGDEVGKGHLKLLDCSSTAAAEGDFDIEVAWKKGSGIVAVKDVVKGLVAEVDKALERFVVKFNDAF
ncbi:hypothetical protein TrLO_g8119 [Triparma laevis f. longispina]|uniref:peptidylprolyl isomerase n=1 Tax=Triparma laevis f. longispina TaxID=1714387 RepID=A0A9W7F5A3_9STRA|nr:hypothetical protein TrLO_g8119 [Triparma laevis f. longispina]